MAEAKPCSRRPMCAPITGRGLEGHAAGDGANRPLPQSCRSTRPADDKLWAEVLNLGGYDVLPLPAHALDTFRTVSGAWHNWKARSDVEALAGIR